jgi:hypothetical protein
MMEAEIFSEAKVNVYMTTWPNIVEDSHVKNQIFSGHSFTDFKNNNILIAQPQAHDQLKISHFATVMVAAKSHSSYEPNCE